VNPSPRTACQARSRRTAERLVQAALNMVATEPAAAITVAGIARRCGVSVGAFYARFPSRDALFTYAAARVRRDKLDRWQHAVVSRDWADLDIDTAADAIVQLLWGLTRSDEFDLSVRLGRILDDPKGHTAFCDSVLSVLEEAVVECPALTNSGSLRPWAVRVGIGVIMTSAVRPGLACSIVPDPTLGEELVHLLRAYLGGPTPTPQSAAGT